MYIGNYLLLFLFAFIMVITLKGFSYLYLHLIHLQIVIFASCIRLVTLNLAHFHSTPSLNTIIMIFVKSINIIMYVVSVVIRHGRRWVLDMIIFMMNTMLESNVS